VGQTQTGKRPFRQERGEGRERRGQGCAGTQIADTQFEIPKLAPPAAYQPKDNVIDIELSEYAGTRDSSPRTAVSIQATIRSSRRSMLQGANQTQRRGKLVRAEQRKDAASATTVMFSRFMGGNLPSRCRCRSDSRARGCIVVRKDVKRVNDLKAKSLRRRSSPRAIFHPLSRAGGGLGIICWPIQGRARREKLNLVYCSDAFVAGDTFPCRLAGGRKSAGWLCDMEPKTTEVADGSGGKAHVLTTNKNLLIVADIFIVNKSFAQAQPKIVEGSWPACSKATNSCATIPTRSSMSSARRSVGSREDEKRTRESASLEWPENLAFFSGRSTRLGVSAASTSRRCMPTAAS